MLGEGLQDFLRKAADGFADATLSHAGYRVSDLRRAAPVKEFRSEGAAVCHLVESARRADDPIVVAAAAIVVECQQAARQRC